MDMQTYFNENDVMNLNNLDIDYNVYLDKINFYDLRYIQYKVLSQFNNEGGDLKKLFEDKFNIFKDNISKSINFKELVYFYEKIFSLYNIIMNQNDNFYNYDSKKPTDSYFTYKKLLIFISYYIIKSQKDLKLKDHNETLIQIINKYLKYKKNNENGNYIIYHNLLKNLFIKFNIDIYCFTAINFCFENEINEIQELENYELIETKIKKNVEMLLKKIPKELFTKSKGITQSYEEIHIIDNNPKKDIIYNYQNRYNSNYQDSRIINSL